jgi:hypothetical protein
MDWFRAITQTHTVIDDTIETPPKHSWFSGLSFLFTNIDIQTTLLELLFAYNKFVIRLSQRIQIMNANYAAARYITCCMQSLSFFCGFVFRYIFFPETKLSREPDESWVNIVSLYRTPKPDTPPTHEHFLDTNDTIDTTDAHYYIEETYRNYDHEDLGDEFGDPTYIRPMELAEMYYSQACIMATRFCKQEPEIDEIVVWSRDTHRDEQIVRVWTSNRLPFPLFQKDVVYSSVVFLHVEYRHLKLGSVGIELILPKQLMVVGNELFSPAFLYRWLKYFSQVPFAFAHVNAVHIGSQMIPYSDIQKSMHTYAYEQ